MPTTSGTELPVMMPNPSQLAMRSVADEGIGNVSQQWAYAAAESHAMIFSFFVSRRYNFDDASKQWRSHKWLIVRNPFYWLVWYPTALLIALGRRIHYIARQHGPVRNVESLIEREVRVWWSGLPSDLN